MSKIDVVFAFDVESATNPLSDDALLRLCRIFSEEGVPVSLFVAGEKARALRRRGRHDAIKAMSEHEICYHGNYWGDFPEPALVYGSRLGWDEAVERALAIETPGLHDVAEIAGQFPVAWCCHQSQRCPQMERALKLAGVRCSACGPRGWFMDWLSWSRGRCSISSQGSWEQTLDPTRRNEVKPPADPDADLTQTKLAFDRLAETEDFVTFVGHPVCFVTADWGGLYPFAEMFRYGSAGPYPRPAALSPARVRSETDREAAYTMVRNMLRWIKKRDDVNLTTYADMCSRDEEARGRWIEWKDVVSLARATLREFNWQAEAGTTFSPADTLGILAFAVDYLWREGRWPDRAPVQRLLGPTEAPLQSEDSSITADREDILAVCLAAYAIIMDQGRVPHAVRGRFLDVGPAELLRVLCRFVTCSMDEGALPEKVTVARPAAVPLAAEEAFIRERRFGSTNRPAGMSFERLRDLTKWQSWSYRPTVRQAERGQKGS